MLVDQRTEGVVVPLNLALEGEGRLELANSSLSEMAVLGVRQCAARVTRRGIEVDIDHDASLNTASAGRSQICCPYGRRRYVEHTLPRLSCTDISIQFGDFFNGAQVIIDTFISSAESNSLPPFRLKEYLA